MQLRGNYCFSLVLAPLTISVMCIPYLHAEQNCKEPVWADEFNGAELDASRWKIIEGDGCAEQLCGWGNNEKQWYSKNNLSVSDGLLHIQARREVGKSVQYTSAKISSENRFTQRYGRFEARMQLPVGSGFWPAFWMLPENRKQVWPLEGEIDILENSGPKPNTILGSIHFGEAWPNNVHYSESLRQTRQWGEAFHLYAVEWKENSIRWFVDDKLYGEVKPADVTPYKWPFNDKPFYLMLNLALGGTLGGEINEEVLPGELLVDYVRVYAPECVLKPE